MKPSNYVAPAVKRYGPLGSITARSQDSTNTDILEGTNPNDDQIEGHGSTDSIEVFG